jgi:hypothetical protein
LPVSKAEMNFESIVLDDGKMLLLADDRVTLQETCRRYSN